MIKKTKTKKNNYHKKTQKNKNKVKKGKNSKPKAKKANNSNNSSKIINNRITQNISNPFTSKDLLKYARPLMQVSLKAEDPNITNQFKLKFNLLCQLKGTNIKTNNESSFIKEIIEVFYKALISQSAQSLLIKSELINQSLSQLTNNVQEAADNSTKINLKEWINTIIKKESKLNIDPKRIEVYINEKGQLNNLTYKRIPFNQKIQKLHSQRDYSYINLNTKQNPFALLKLLLTLRSKKLIACDQWVHIRQDIALELMFSNNVDIYLKNKEVYANTLELINLLEDAFDQGTVDGEIALTILLGILPNVFKEKDHSSTWQLHKSKIKDLYATSEYKDFFNKTAILMLKFGAKSQFLTSPIIPLFPVSFYQENYDENSKRRDAYNHCFSILDTVVSKIEDSRYDDKIQIILHNYVQSLLQQNHLKLYNSKKTDVLDNQSKIYNTLTTIKCFAKHLCEKTVLLIIEELLKQKFYLNINNSNRNQYSAAIILNSIDLVNTQFKKLALNQIIEALSLFRIYLKHKNIYSIPKNLDSNALNKKLGFHYTVCGLYYNILNLNNKNLQTEFKACLQKLLKLKNSKPPISINYSKR